MVLTAQQTRLSSTEISNLWTAFQIGTMIQCGATYFLTAVEDQDTRNILEYVLNISQQRVQTITHFLNAENHPIPIGFTAQDINTEAPRLFSDHLVLLYLLNMGRYMLTGDSMMFSISEQDNVSAFFSECLIQSKDLADMARKLAVQKGIYVHAPDLPTPEQVTFVEKQNFLDGWLGDRRPLLGIEISNLIYNAERNALGEALITGLSQVAKSKEVREFLLRGKEIAKKHFEIFCAALQKEQLSATTNVTSEVTASTISPFSDKLITFHITALVASGIGQYGVALSSSPRRDIGLLYIRSMNEIISFAEDGATILIKNRWMEEPPRAVDRNELAKRKE